MKNAILIGGYYGAGNIGDEAILTTMLHDLREVRPKLDLTVLSWDPEGTRRQYQVEAVHWKDMGGMVDAARASDLIIVGGGGLFHDHWGLDPESTLRVNHGGITSYGSLPLLARMLGVPCMLYGVGIGPLESDLARAHTRLAVERCQVVTLRDEGSYQLLKETGFDPGSASETRVEVFADPAFGLITALPRLREVDDLLKGWEVREGAPLLGINLRYWDRPHPPEEWLPRVARALKAFLADKRDVEVLLIPFQIHDESVYTDDLAVCERLWDEWEGRNRVHLVSRRLSPGTAQALIRRCKLFLGMRYHGLVMAMLEGVPAVALPYDAKVEHLMGEAGLEAFCLPTFAPEAEELQRVLERVWEGIESLAETLDAVVEGMMPKARASADLAVRLLDRDPPAPDVALLQDFALERVKALEKVDRALEDAGRDNRAGRTQPGGLFADLLSWWGKAVKKVREVILSQSGGSG